MVVDIKPKFVSQSHIFLNYLFRSHDRFLSLDSFLNNLMHFIEIYLALSNKIIIADNILIPNLDNKDIGVHILGFGWVKYVEFKSIVKISDRPARPMYICLLIITSADLAPDKDVV